MVFARLKSVRWSVVVFATVGSVTHSFFDRFTR